MIFNASSREHTMSLAGLLKGLGYDFTNQVDKDLATAFKEWLNGKEMPGNGDELTYALEHFRLELGEKQAKPSRGWIGCIYGPPKTGKSTFAALAPKPIFADVEDGLGWISCERKDTPTWEAWLKSLEQFKASSYQTFVTDTLDVLEKRLWEYLCVTNSSGKKWASIESPGYGKGYAEAAEVWVKVFTELRSIARTGKNFLFTAHSNVKTVLNPEGESYDRNSIAIHAKVADYFFAQCDIVGFAHFDSRTRKNENGDFVAATSGTRLLSVGGDTLSAQVGNRFGLIGKLPMNQESFELFGRKN